SAIRSSAALDTILASRPDVLATTRLGPGGIMVNESGCASIASLPASTVTAAPSGGMISIYSSGLSARASTAPASTRDTQTATLPPRVIQVLDNPSSPKPCGGCSANRDRDASRLARLVIVVLRCANAKP